MNPVEIDAEYDALRSALAQYVRDGGRLAVVKAPPGSGKTHTLVEVLSTLAGEGLAVAVAAQTNSQADDICARWASIHPEIRVSRFAGNGTSAPNAFPSSVAWINEAKALPAGPGITVATTAKWSLTNVAAPYDLLAVDEAWQMSWSDLMQCALLSDKFLMIGDPGQIPPVVTIDVRRWETSPRAPHSAAPEVVLAEPALEGVLFSGSLPACRRLPAESVEFVSPFYDFDFAPYVAPGSRGLTGADWWGDALSAGRPLALTVPTPEHGAPVEVDHDVASAVAAVVRKLLEGATKVRMGDTVRPITPADIGVTSSHRVMNSAITAALGHHADEIRVDTPERWQGLERRVMIAVHPLSGVSVPSSFDLETGRLCVMASRHEVAFIMVTRDHVGDTLRNFVPSAEQAPGRPDSVGRGHHAHLKFWNQLEGAGSVVALT